MKKKKRKYVLAKCDGCGRPIRKGYGTLRNLCWGCYLGAADDALALAKAWD
jgi:hypothetical protein